MNNAKEVDLERRDDDTAGTITLREMVEEAKGNGPPSLGNVEFAFDTAGVDLGGPADPNQTLDDDPYDEPSSEMSLCSVADTLSRV